MQGFYRKKSGTRDLAKEKEKLIINQSILFQGAGRVTDCSQPAKVQFFGACTGQCLHNFRLFEA